MLVLPNLIYRFNAIPIEIPASYFMDTNKFILKLIWRGKRPRLANTILRRTTTPTSEFTVKLQYSRQYGIGERINK